MKPETLEKINWEHRGDPTGTTPFYSTDSLVVPTQVPDTAKLFELGRNMSACAYRDAFHMVDDTDALARKLDEELAKYQRQLRDVGSGGPWTTQGTWEEIPKVIKRYQDALDELVSQIQGRYEQKMEWANETKSAINESK